MSALERINAAWGAAPDWVTVLAQAIDEGLSQSKAAQRLGYSAATVSQVLSNKYGGDLSAIEARVRQVFMQRSIACPELGEIPAERCMAERRRPFAATNSMRVRLYQACRSCPNNLEGRAS